jgi:hypothetical protein
MIERDDRSEPTLALLFILASWLFIHSVVLPYPRLKFPRVAVFLPCFYFHAVEKDNRH